MTRLSLPALMRRLAPGLVAFVLALLGISLLVADRSAPVVAVADGVPTVVAVAAVPAATTTAELLPLLEVRDIAPSARVSGALSSLDEVPDGVITSPLAAGQQILASSVADDPREQLGGDLVAVSAELEAQQWKGPVATTGDVVDVYALGGTGATEATIVATGVVVLDAPSPDDDDDTSVVILGVPRADATRVVGAIAGDGIWLVTS
jgi:hypothetical protein